MRPLYIGSKNRIRKLNIPYKEIQLGEVTLINNIADITQETLKGNTY